MRLDDGRVMEATTRGTTASPPGSISYGAGVSEVSITVRVTAGDNAGIIGLAPGEPVIGATVEAAHAEPPRDNRVGTTDAAGVAALELAGPGTYLVSVTHNVAGGAILADARVDLPAEGLSIDLVGQAFPPAS